MPQAIHISPIDNVVVALHPIAKGTLVEVDGLSVTALEDIPQGHKMAVRAIAAGENVVKYGLPIGHVTGDIQPGQWLHTHNVKTNLSGEVEYVYNPTHPVVEPVEPETFMGFRRADGRAAEGELAQRAARLREHDAVMVEHGAPAADLLTERERHGVLQMRAADLHHVAVLRAQALKRRQQAVDRRQHLLLERDARSHVHRRREGVVRALRAIDVIVRMHERLPQQRIGAVGDDLVDVHVALRAAARLPHDQGEVLSLIHI